MPFLSCTHIMHSLLRGRYAKQANYPVPFLLGEYVCKLGFCARNVVLSAKTRVLCMPM